MAGGVVLGLDLATKLNGFCAGDGNGTPVAGAFRLPDFGSDLGGFMVAFSAHLRALIERYEPELVVPESPILTRFDTLTKVRKLYGAGMEVRRMCEVRRIRCEEEDLRAIKRELAGFSGAEKDDMVFAAQKLGIDLPERKSDGREDAADAAGAWLLGLRKLSPAISARWDTKLYSSRGALL